MVDTGKLQQLGRELLLAIGEDPDREGLQDTPARWARWWAEFMDHDPGTIDRVFADTSDEMVVVKGLRVYSLCEHHLLPWYADVTVGYLPTGQVIGLSKLARIAHLHAHQLQVQERYTTQVADTITQVTGSPDVAVVARGVHLCMVARGVRTEGTMVASCMRGRFREHPQTRSEFLQLANGGH